MIRPAGHRVLVKVERIEEQDPVYISAKKAGIALVDSDESQRRQSGLDRGVVVAIGPTAFKAFGDVNWCEVGDFVAFAKYAGKIIEDKEVKFLVLNDEDIIAVL